MRRLESAGWLTPIKVKATKSRVRLYLMEASAAKNQPVDSYELLQAYLPAGVVSYFGALAFFSLTTQTPPFYHIGRLLSGEPQEPPLDLPSPSKRAVKRNPFGTELFRFEGTIYYETRRYRALTPGIQLREVGPRTWLRITTLEQTLLDTLLQPTRCGGEAVIFEAWDKARDTFDAERMADHLIQIGREDLWRRVGAVLNLVGAKVDGTSLADGLHKVRARVNRDSPEIPLLPGLHFTDRDGEWLVRVP